jgi:3'(2'), 5'-bisphosphate nucleotidase
MISEIDMFIPFLKSLGKDVLEIYGSDFDSVNKLDNTPVTKADILSHNKIVSFLKDNFPDDLIISEEDDSKISDFGPRVWVIDPLDGTKDFIQKTGDFSILISLFENNLPIFGITYLPAKNIFYYAKKGNGAYKLEGDNLKQISTSEIIGDGSLRIVRSRNHFRESDQKIADSLKNSTFVKCGSAGIKFGLISEGNAEICFYSAPGLGIWDCASSHIILEEAGGCVFDTNGDIPTYDFKNRKMLRGFIGSNNLANKNKIMSIIKRINLS